MKNFLNQIRHISGANKRAAAVLLNKLSDNLTAKGIKVTNLENIKNSPDERVEVINGLERLKVYDLSNLTHLDPADIHAKLVEISEVSSLDESLDTSVLQARIAALRAQHLSRAGQII